MISILNTKKNIDPHSSENAARNDGQFYQSITDPEPSRHPCDIFKKPRPSDRPLNQNLKIHYLRTFEYVTILFSIMLGVCITQMAVNVVLVIQNFNTAVLYAPPILWNAAALLAILAHWVNFYKADKRESWNAVQITLVFLTLLIYFIPATLLSRAPVINGRVNYEILFEDNKTLIYVSVIIFASLTMAKNYLVYNNRKAFVYWYYSVAISMVVIALALDSKPVDLMLAVGICVAEVCNHYFFNPIKLP